jgi:hypothetical protein
MLNSIPEAVNAMAVAVIQNHPNAVNCSCYRKVLLRSGGEAVGGIPTLGGMAVLDSEDEDDIDIQWIGNGYALQAEPFQPSMMMDNQDANNSYAVQIPFLIVPESVDNEFTLKKRDLIMLLFNDGLIKLAWEIVAIETVINVPPFTHRYLLNKRADLNLVADAFVQ